MCIKLCLYKSHLLRTKQFVINISCPTQPSTLKPDNASICNFDSSCRIKFNEVLWLHNRIYNNNNNRDEKHLWCFVLRKAYEIDAKIIEHKWMHVEIVHDESNRLRWK